MRVDGEWTRNGIGKPPHLRSLQLFSGGCAYAPPQTTIAKICPLVRVKVRGLELVFRVSVLLLM